MLLRLLKWLGRLMLVVLVAAAAAVALIDWGFLKEPIESRTSRFIGRQLTIAGDIDIHLALHPRLIVNRIRLANADWSDAPYMLKIEELAVAFDPLEWLTGTPEIAWIRVEQPWLLLERASHQRANWQFVLGKDGGSGAHQPQQAALPVKVSELTIADASIDLRNRVTDRALTLGFDNLHAERQGEELVLNAKGKRQATLSTAGDGRHLGAPVGREIGLSPQGAASLRANRAWCARTYCRAAGARWPTPRGGS